MDISRTLTYAKSAKGKEIVEIAQGELLKRTESFVVLGDPGMGKTWMSKWLAGQPRVIRKTAKAFLRAAHPRTIAIGKTLVIDALDELASADSDDPLQKVLKQLQEAGAPRFILFCRARDWRGKTAERSIDEDYDASPIVASIKPFTRKDAQCFLADALEGDTQELLDRLDQDRSGELLGNPLTLSLFAKAFQHGEMPHRRADLFRLSCDNLCLEHNDARQETELS